MADLMIDIETLATGPDATILTIAAQVFDPHGAGYLDRHFYARIDFDQPGREIDNSTIEWWASQPAEAKEEALGESNRVPLKDALGELAKLIWQSDLIWANGPTFDMTILEHAYKSFGIALPWKYYKVRDARTVYGLWPSMPKPPISHHALEDTRRQIELLQQTLQHLGVEKLKR